MKLSGLKVTFLAATLGRGGAERQLFYILQSLQQQGALTQLLCLTQGEFWEERIKALGVEVRFVGQRRSRLRRLVRIIQEVRQRRPAILQSAHFYTGAYVGPASRLLGIPGIGALRSNGVMEVKDSGSVTGWLSLRVPGVIAANSRAAIRYAEGYGIRPERLYFLPNVVDTQALSPAGVRPAPPLRLVAVGSLNRIKRFDRFLRLLARLRKDGTRSVTGLIAGDGPLRSQLEQEAQALGLMPDGVEFRGSVSDVGPVFRGSDIAVLTSDFEGTPNVILEAMSSALPVVATRVGGIPDIVEEGRTGHLVAPDDESALFEAVARLVDDQAGRIQMGSNARSYVESTHSLSGLPAKLEELYRLALSRP